MKYYYLHKEDDDFTEVLEDPIVKKIISTKISWLNHLILGFTDDTEDSSISYFVIKFGEYIIPSESIIPDRAPIPNVDYRQDKKWMNGKFVKN